MTATERSAIFENIVCGIDGSRRSREAVRQAIALSGASGRIDFVVLYHETGLAAQTPLGETRARYALEEALELAEMFGVAAAGKLVAGPEARELLRSEVNGRDLLVVGSYGGARIGGMLEDAATWLDPRAELPVLVARRSADSEDFPQSILVATDGSQGSWAAARLAGDIAAEKRGELRVISIPNDETRSADNPEVLAQLAMIEERFADVGPLYEESGAVWQRICNAARAHQSSLIVLGRRGIGESQPLGSVSARVAQRARCSVLLVAPD